MAMKHRAKRISARHYIDHDGSGFAHSFTLKETKEFIDCELDGDNKNATL